MTDNVRHQYQVITGDTTITTEPAILVGFHVIVATATEDIQIEDGDGGTIVYDIKAVTPINTTKTCHHIYMPNGIHVEYQGAATGTIRIDYNLA
jgi:hypothetical protein